MNGDMDKCKQKFLKFMQNNFSNLPVMYKGIQTNATFYIIVKKVKEFIDSMEVKLIKDVTTKVTTISVTLHDIIKKLTFTSFDSDHCKSEKLFMAVLLAIQRLHCPTPSDGNDYTLTFEFAPSLLGPSGLQKTSKTCSEGNVEIDASKDPVDANIFGFVLTALEQVPQQPSPSPSPSPPEIVPQQQQKPVPSSIEEGNAEEISKSEVNATTENDGENVGYYSTAGWGWKENVLTGDKLYETYHKYRFLDVPNPVIELVNHAVLINFKKNEKIYDSAFSVLDNPTEYHIVIVRTTINENKNLFDDKNLFDELMKLLSLTPDEDLYNKLLFIHAIFFKWQSIDPVCSKILTIILGLSASTHVSGFNPHLIHLGGSKSRRKPARKTRRGRTRKSKAKTHRHRRHSRIRKHKKYTSSRRR
jgi:hypothetical protein